MDLLFLNLMLKDRSLLDYPNLFSPNEYEKSDKIIQKYKSFIKMNLNLMMFIQERICLK